MKITIKNGLPFTEVILIYKNKSIRFDKVIIDTGSAGTIFDIDELSKIEFVPEPEDTVHTIFGVGGTEFIIRKTIDRIKVESMELYNFPIEIGSVDYGIDIQGILGFDFLMETNAIIDLKKLEIRSES